MILQIAFLIVYKATFWQLLYRQRAKFLDKQEFYPQIAHDEI